MNTEREPHIFSGHIERILPPQTQHSLDNEKLVCHPMDDTGAQEAFP